jgi:hypothetical protein
MGVGGWNGIESGFGDDEFDGLRDARRAPPTARLETLVLGNRWLPVTDLLVINDDDCVSIHRHEMFANYCTRWSSSDL